MYIILIAIFLAVVSIPETIKENGMSPEQLTVYREEQAQAAGSFFKFIWWAIIGTIRGIIRLIWKMIFFIVKWTLIIGAMIGGLIGLIYLIAQFH